ncbi:phosphoglycerate kinase [Candidatus Woesebacteria bacterium]|nr:phosphoglycerate kinase [Candidatus Woesebacteria bacterium]
MDQKTIKYIDEVEIKNKTILLRVDFNVSLNPNHLTIADDARIRQSMPTIQYLLQSENHNKLVLVSHLGRPKGERLSKFSLHVVCDRLESYLNSNFKVRLIDNFLTESDNTFIDQKEHEVFLLENIRFYPQEEKNDATFSKQLAAIADVYVNDGFAVSHRNHASVVGVTEYLPSYGGLLLKREIQMIEKAMHKPEKPLVAIIGGAKISTKIDVLSKLVNVANYLIVGGGVANTLLHAQGINIGDSLAERDALKLGQKLLFQAAQHDTTVILPSDVVIGDPDELEHGGMVIKLEDMPPYGRILDIGPETKARIGNIIAKAKTIVWNGPLGYFENIHYRQGTDFMYYAITNNTDATSIVGGGDTLAAISKKEYLDKITHISTGGGAMLEFIEKGSLPGIDALKR